MVAFSCLCVAWLLPMQVEAVSMFAGPEIKAGLAPASIATGDFNGDGIADIVTANELSNDVSVLLGLGNGLYNSAVNYAVGTGPISLIAGDFNGDGFLDLAVADSVSNNVSVLLGVGDGTFAAAASYATGLYPISLIAGDFNGDGFLDLAVANSTSINVSVLLGVGDGTFAATANYAVGAGAGPTTLTTGDFNGDGYTDLVVANFLSHNVSILLGAGNGTFAAAVNFAAGYLPEAVTTDDFNLDGMVDLAVRSSNAVNILLGVGNGTFNAAVAYAVKGSGEIATGDLNADGYADLVVLGTGSQVQVLLGLGGGSFNVSLSYGVGAIPRYVDLRDLNGDGILDLAVANRGSDSVSVLLGVGDGTFSEPPFIAVGSSPAQLASLDLNADGYTDLVVANSLSHDVSILLGVGNGEFAAAVNYAAGSSPLAVTTDDFNLDGMVDLAVRSYNAVNILLGVGNGTFNAAVAYAVKGSVGSIATGDLNADGYADLVVAVGLGGVYTLSGVGDGTFNTAVKLIGVGAAYTVATGDFNQDGYADVVSKSSSSVNVSLGVGNDTFNPAVSYSTTSTGRGQIITTDLNNDGFLDLAVANSALNNVSVLLGVGDGTFAATANYAVGVFPATLTTGDFNGDGFLDLAVANVDSSNVSVLLGAGNGTFGAAVSYHAGIQPSSIAAGDFDGNDTIDIAVANPGRNRVSMLMNQTDVAAPAGSISINQGNWVTNSTSVTLTLTCTDNIACSQMQFSNDNTTWSTLIAQSTSTVWVMAAGIDGTRTVYARFTDAAGNISAIVSDTIVLDTTAPVIIAPMNLTVAAVDGYGISVTDAAIVAFLGGATSLDNVSGTSSVISDNAPATFALGTTTVSFTATDSAGNSSTATATVTVSTPDTDGDGINDFVDAFPNDAAASVDSDGDGYPDGWNANTYNPAIIDAAIVATSLTLDAFPNDANLWLIIVDTTSPVVTAPDNLIVSATGVMTPVTLGTGSAADNVDGALIATADFTGPFMQGTHNITWRATDTAGNVGVATQTVTVLPAVTSSLTLPSAVTLPVGARHTLQATATKADGSSEVIRFLATWSSSDTGVARVTNTGVVIAKAAGIATITGSYGGLNATSLITVTNPVLNSIILTPVSLSLKVGESKGLGATGFYSDSSSTDVRVPASWSSSNPDVFTVTNWGKVTAVAAGTATISASWQGVNVSAGVTVSPATLSSIVLSADNATPAVGQRIQLQATGLYSDGGLANVKNISVWSSSNGAIATVDGKGLVTALSAGVVDVYATTGATIGTLSLTVSAATLSSLEVSPNTREISVGDVEKFNATGLMSDGSKFKYGTQDVVWSSSDPLIASVDDKGFTTGLSVGSVDIYASLSLGEQAWGSLTVNAETLTGLQLDTYTNSLPAGQKFAFRVTGNYSDGSSKRLKPKQVIWSSSDVGVLSISKSGFATGQGAGTATLTATVGALSASSTLTVSGATLGSLAMKPLRTTYRVGTVKRFVVDGTFSDASVLRLYPGAIMWRSSAPAVVNINPKTGIATMHTAGIATITATDTTTGLVTVSSTLSIIDPRLPY